MIKFKKAGLYVLFGLLMLISVVLGVLCYPKLDTEAFAEGGTEVELAAAATGTEGDVFTPVDGFGYSPTNNCLYIKNDGGIVTGIRSIIAC